MGALRRAFVRKLPPRRGFLMAAGLEQALGYLENLAFSAEDIARLRGLGAFPERLLEFLGQLRFTGDVDALPEGTVFFPDEPILRVTAPLPQAQPVETRLINLVHFETVVASKAAGRRGAGRLAGENDPARRGRHARSSLGPTGLALRRTRNLGRIASRLSSRRRDGSDSRRRSCARLKSEMEASRSAFRLAGGAKLLAVLQPTVRRLEAFSTRRAVLFRRRIAERRMVDGHGDLRPEHVFLKGSARIINCLEFRADLRQLDPVNEFAYFALARRAGTRTCLCWRYRQHTGDRPPGALVRFYAALNALVRSRIAIEHVAEPGARTSRHWTARAAAYLAIAEKESRFLSR